jgi:hypothetical protein
MNIIVGAQFLRTFRAIISQHRLGELVKAGQAKERDAAELADIAERKRRAADSAEDRADSAWAAEAKQIIRLRRLAKKPVLPVVKSPPIAPESRRCWEPAPAIDFRSAITPADRPINISYCEKSVQIDRQIIVGERFAIATDGNQWVLQRLTGQKWLAISFVRSTKDTLVRCMREAGAAKAEIETLLADLPAHFPGWEGYHDASRGPPAMWRVRMPNGAMTGAVNLSRAKDAARATGGTVVPADFKNLKDAA